MEFKNLKILLAIILLNGIFKGEAVTSIPYIQEFRQADNTTISVIQRGDEHFNYYETIDGIPIFRKGNSFYYGKIINNEIIISNTLVHKEEERNETERYFINEKLQIISFIQDLKNIHRKSTNINKYKIHHNNKSKKSDYYIGSKKGLVILVNFQDLKMTYPNAKENFYRSFNETGFSDNMSIGSVHDYFLEQSYGKFNLNFDVVGPVTIKQGHSYYGENLKLTGGDIRPYQMVVEACQMIDEQVDFSKYDWDDDGEVEQVFIIYAGYGEHAGAPSSTIWPHKSTLGLKSITLDGVKIDTYACSCELQGRSGSKMNGIGTPCHEFSHCLGFPDVYDTDYSGAFGMSYWDVMNSGSHSGPTGFGEIPYGYSAYERWLAGWLEPVEITESTHIESLRNLGDYPEAYVIYNDANRNEFYIIENHQNTRWFQYVDTYTGNHGMMVTHINYDATAWASNRVNPDPENQRMSIIPADNSYGESGEEFAGDLFPGSHGVKSLTDDSHEKVGGKLFNPNIDGSFKMHKILSSINEENGVVSFDVIVSSNLRVPTISEATEITEDGYTANWSEVPEAECYELEQIASIKFQNLINLTRNETIKDIKVNSQRLSWLYPNGITKYRVRSLIGGIPSNWSDYHEVNYDQSGTADITPDEGETEIWGLNGVKRSELSRGINIVRKNGKVRKVVVE